MTLTKRRASARLVLSLLIGAASLLAALPGMAEECAEGFVQLFDGKSLDGWDGNPDFWRVEDGTITGQTTPEKPTKGNTFLIWRQGEVADFDLRFEYRMEGGNSGVQYRSFENPDKWGKWVIGGYQADFESGDRYSGILYGEKYRGILANRGQKTVVGANHKPQVVEQFADSAELQKHVKKGDWNEYRVTAEGFHFTHYINGQKMSECVDEDKEMRRASGLLALQLHQGPPMKVQFRNIRIKHLPCKKEASKESGAAVRKAKIHLVAAAKKPDAKKIVFIAGPKSHGYGAHEHYAGCMLLADRMEQLPGVECEVVKDGWPKDTGILDDADSIVIFCDGGGRHPIIPHIDEVAPLMDQGVGLVCLHYGVEVPKGKPGDALLKWTGGYFEAYWSVNPHWTAEFKEFPEHPVTRGVKPFAINDEWYYHMRFPEGMKNVTPILTAVPPDKTRERPDGAHSGNPTVRARKGMPEHLMWVVERSDGGRGMGFTGGHWHWSWACDSFRTVVLNGIAWTAKIDIPEGGIPSKRPTMDELEKNQDYPKPDRFQREEWEKKIVEWNG